VCVSLLSSSRQSLAHLHTPHTTPSHCCPVASSLPLHCGQNDPELKRRGADPLDEARRQLLAEEDAAKAAQAAEAAGDGGGAMVVEVAEEDQGPAAVKEVEVDTARAELERLRIAEETAAAAAAAKAAQEAEEAAANKAREEERARVRAEHEERARRDQVVAESFALFKQVRTCTYSRPLLPSSFFPPPFAAVHAY